MDAQSATTPQQEVEYDDAEIAVLQVILVLLQC